MTKEQASKASLSDRGNSNPLPKVEEAENPPPATPEAPAQWSIEMKQPDRTLDRSSASRHFHHSVTSIHICHIRYVSWARGHISIFSDSDMATPEYSALCQMTKPQISFRNSIFHDDLASVTSHPLPARIHTFISSTPIKHTATGILKRKFTSAAQLSRTLTWKHSEWHGDL